MISDVLSDAINEIDGYLDNRLFDDVYKDDVREEVVRVRNDMEKLRIKLDKVPEG